MKLQERRRETLDRLPELPEGVEVPDDISGLAPPPAARAVAGGIRWMRWLIALVVIAVGAGVATLVLTRGDDTQTAQEVQELGSDRHLTTVRDLTPGAVVVDYLEFYGTDNPTFVTLVPELGSDRHLATVRDLTTAVGHMELYGTDNPTFVTEGPGRLSQSMEFYGTDNPTFAPMRQLGSDRHLGTVVELAADTHRLSEFMELYGTDNPVLE